jgi:hypothetical protein
MYAKGAGLSFNGQPAAVSTQVVGGGSSTAEQQILVLSSGKETNGTLRADGALQLFSASPNASLTAAAVIEFGGTQQVFISPTTMNVNSGMNLQGSISMSNVSIPQVQFVPVSTAHVSQQPYLQAQSLSTGTSSESIFMVLSTGKENGNADAAMQLSSQNASGGGTAQAVLEFGGAIGLTVTASGIDAPNYHAPQSVSGWPIAAGSGTVGPAQLSSGLSNALNSIYNAGHAAGIW